MGTLQLRLPLGDLGLQGLARLVDGSLAPGFPDTSADPLDEAFTIAWSRSSASASSSVTTSLPMKAPVQPARRVR